MSPVSAPPQPAGATARQAHEAERWQARYGRVRARVEPDGVLIAHVIGDNGSYPWATLELAPSGKVLTVRYNMGDPRELDLTRNQRAILAELRAYPEQWRTPSQVALSVDVQAETAGRNLRILAGVGLLESDPEAAPTRPRYRPAAT